MPRETISLDDLTPNNLGVLKKINEVTLPTAYADAWYTTALDADQIVKLAFYSELPVGAVKAKAIRFSPKQTFVNVANAETALSDDKSKILPNAVYIETLAVLKSYRRLGVGAKLLAHVVDEAKRRFIHEVVLHVSTDNTAALDWYTKRGFAKVEVVPRYYAEQGLAQPDAWILSLAV